MRFWKKENLCGKINKRKCWRMRKEKESTGTAKKKTGKENFKKYNKIITFRHKTERNYIYMRIIEAYSSLFTNSHIWL